METSIKRLVDIEILLLRRKFNNKTFEKFIPLEVFLDSSAIDVFLKIMS